MKRWIACGWSGPTRADDRALTIVDLVEEFEAHAAEHGATPRVYIQHGTQLWPVVGVDQSPDGDELYLEVGGGLVFGADTPLMPRRRPERSSVRPSGGAVMRTLRCRKEAGMKDTDKDPWQDEGGEG